MWRGEHTFTGFLHVGRSCEGKPKKNTNLSIDADIFVHLGQTYINDFVQSVLDRGHTSKRLIPGNNIYFSYRPGEILTGFYMNICDY